MQSLRKLSIMAINLQKRPIALFSKDNWKDRDEASEKVYISQTESTCFTTQRKPSKNCWRK